ncbi:unnamed protein product [Linum trigynum]|uniref:Uncharacterized protein n=1 Tax=Linum trigynum TaxID=586398 RepID=A0AAV2GSJ8_9ROSI
MQEPVQQWRVKEADLLGTVQTVVIDCGQAGLATEGSDAGEIKGSGVDQNAAEIQGVGEVDMVNGDGGEVQAAEAVTANGGQLDLVVEGQVAGGGIEVGKYTVMEA